MRLIDADALKSVMIDTLEAIRRNPKMDNQEAHLLAAFHTVGEMVNDAQSVDAVPVVRCRECAHNLRPDKPNSVCGLDMPIFDIYGFCSKGERREEDGT